MQIFPSLKNCIMRGPGVLCWQPLFNISHQLSQQVLLVCYGRLLLGANKQVHSISILRFFLVLSKTHHRLTSSKKNIHPDQTYLLRWQTLTLVKLEGPQGLSQHGCQGCLALAEFLDSNVWHPRILAILLHTVVFQMILFQCF